MRQSVNWMQRAAYNDMLEEESRMIARMSNRTNGQQESQLLISLTSSPNMLWNDFSKMTSETPWGNSWWVFFSIVEAIETRLNQRCKTQKYNEFREWTVSGSNDKVVDSFLLMVIIPRTMGFVSCLKWSIYSIFHLDPVYVILFPAGEILLIFRNSSMSVCFLGTITGQQVTAVFLVKSITFLKLSVY